LAPPDCEALGSVMANDEGLASWVYGGVNSIEVVSLPSPYGGVRLDAYADVAVTFVSPN